MWSRRTSLMLALLLPIASFAAETTPNMPPDTFKAEPYWTVHIGSASVSANQSLQSFHYANFGGAVGFQFTPNLAMEFWASATFFPQKDKWASSFYGQRVDTRYDAAGFFLTARTSGDIYVKGRVGLVASNFSYQLPRMEMQSNQYGGLGYGLGAGMLSNGIRFELEFLVLPKVEYLLYGLSDYDVDLAFLSIGMNF